VLQVFHYRNTWLLFVVNSGICGAFLAFTGLWGVPFFVQHHALGVPQAALITSMMLVLFALGGPLMGGLSDRWQLRRRPYALGAGATVAGFGLLAAWPAAPLPLLVAALAVASLGAGAMAISFGYAKESVPLPLQGTVTGVVNAGVMVGTLTQMPLIGLILDRHWQGAALNGVRQYSLEAFQLALLLLAGWMAVSFVLLLATKETHARQST
jgi:MFS family permease